MESLDIAQICKRIAVHRPYFAFSELKARSRDKAIYGMFSAEQVTGSELGPVSSAELGRHLAILGSCAAALDGPDDMTYYLASKGRLKLLPNTHEGQEDQRGIAVAAVTSRNRRTMTAEVLGHYGSLAAHLWCEYQILSHEVFSRIFSGHHTDSTPQADKSPYSTPVAFDVLSANAESIVVCTSEVGSENFAGHFDHYPSWPVAILADTFGQARTVLLHNMLDRQVNYRVGYINVDAFQLAPASARLTFEVTCVSSFPSLGRYVFGAKVLWGDKTIAAMESEVYASTHR
ncbi:hypothetical protein [Paraburkholderia humisilvae]|uniref:A-factor biosynthesis hotdog domain-containing protein n=1 Tax=Paraburkholderia humisilvae TaxID=627669 RepID=A0A6J5E9G0_9BURK|nr:hypothetical protein [Paraburkholderia humisilvae]CAB3763160.1 hypothetical protein LMG29542_04516 [Paraburkholderia humisilvae]